MNTYEAIGVGFVILFTCFGIVAVSYFCYRGLKAEEARQAIGKRFEEQAVRDHLGETLSGIPGVKFE